MTTQRPPSLDPTAADRWAGMACATSPWLHEEVAGRMEDRLSLIRLQPRSWAHWTPVAGGLQVHQRLAQRYPDADCWLVEDRAQRAQQALARLSPRWWQPRRWGGARVQAGVPPAGTAQLVWANMALHMAADPQALIARWHQTLAVDGFLMFSCLGPDTLRQLRIIYQQQGWPPGSHDYTDMHDWGDMLLGAGFAEPVMDMERITLQFPSPERMLQELRGLGRNLHPQRFPALRGRRWRQTLLQALAAGPLELEFEIVYGHAFKPAPRVPVQAQTVLTLEQFRQGLRRPHTGSAEG
ncbi:MAG: biotin synthase [Rhodoferax sp.]|nr:biotin synthase [Rhodoferax sp.]